MATAIMTELKRFTKPDEVRTFPNGRLELLHFGDGVIGKITLQPGWRWSKDVKPIAGTEWCEAPHFQYVISGRLHIVTSDKHEFDFKTGEVLSIGGGHDAWVVGREPFVAIDWAGMAEYAKQ
jgi:hypothetical protein